MNEVDLDNTNQMIKPLLNSLSNEARANLQLKANQMLRENPTWNNTVCVMEACEATRYDDMGKVPHYAIPYTSELEAKFAS